MQTTSYINEVQIKKIEALKSKIEDFNGNSLSKDELKDHIEKEIRFSNSINFILSKTNSSYHLILIQTEFNQAYVTDEEQVVGVGKFTMNEANWSDISSGEIINPSNTDYESIRLLNYIAATIRRELNKLI